MLGEVSTGSMGTVKFVAIAGAGVWIGARLSNWVAGQSFVANSSDTVKTLVGYAAMGLGVVVAFKAAHAVLAK